MKLSVPLDARTDTHTQTRTDTDARTVTDTDTLLCLPKKARSAQESLQGLRLFFFSSFFFFCCGVIYVNADRKINLLART